MIDSKIIISVAIVLIIGAIAAGYQISNNPEILWQVTNPDSTTPSSSGSGGGAGGAGGASGAGSANGGASGSSGLDNIGGNGGYSVSPSEAQSGGEPVYVVPIEKDGKIIGEIHIDPVTGKNIGGGGGAPP
ncbi:MAG: hypothetical protein PWQ74_263 [Methanobacteriaceae archaeon]|nr:hypothetical protein [Methanobacteriaceae archaeon]